MRNTTGRLTTIVALIAAGLALTGCVDDGEDWVAPSEISGTWISERQKGHPDRGPLRLHMTITQRGSDVSAAQWMVYESGVTTSGSRYRGTYVSGLVTLNVPLAPQPFYFRFTSDTTMYNVIDPGDDRGGMRYTRQ